MPQATDLAGADRQRCGVSLADDILCTHGLGVKVRRPWSVVPVVDLGKDRCPRLSQAPKRHTERVARRLHVPSLNRRSGRLGRDNSWC